MFIENTFDEDLCNLETGSGDEDILEPVTFVVDGDLIEVQKECAEKSFEEATKFFEIGAGFLFFGVFRENVPPIEAHVVSHASDALVFDEGYFLFGHEAFVFFGEASVEVIFGDAFEDAVAEKFEALVGFCAEGEAIGGFIDDGDVVGDVLEVGSFDVGFVDEGASIEIKIMNFVGDAVVLKDSLDLGLADLFIVGIKGIKDKVFVVFVNVAVLEECFCVHGCIC